MHDHHHGRRFARPEHAHSADDRPERGHRGHGGERARERNSLGRFFAHGDLRLLVLTLVAEKPRHGYEIIKAIEDRVAGAYTPSPGVIYPTLTLLEELGYVTVTAADGKKLHEITSTGRAFLDANQPTLAAILVRMDDAVRAAGDGPAPKSPRLRKPQARPAPPHRPPPHRRSDRQHRHRPGHCRHCDRTHLRANIRSNRVGPVG